MYDTLKINLNDIIKTKNTYSINFFHQHDGKINVLYRKLHSIKSKKGLHHIGLIFKDYPNNEYLITIAHYKEYMNYYKIKKNDGIIYAKNIEIVKDD